MGLEVLHVSELGDVSKVPLTSSSGAFGNAKISKVATGVLAGDIADAFEDIWVNPETVPILIFRVVVNVTVAAGVGAGEYFIIGTDADGTGMTGVKVIDGADANAVAWYDNAYGPVALGGTAVKCCAYLNEAGGALTHLTAQYKVQDCSALAAVVYIHYFPLK